MDRSTRSSKVRSHLSAVSKLKSTQQLQRRSQTALQPNNSNPLAIYRPQWKSKRKHSPQRLRLHRIAAEDAFKGLDQTSALNLDWSFLTRLRDSGRAAAEGWLATQ